MWLPVAVRLVLPSLPELRYALVPWERSPRRRTHSPPPRLAQSLFAGVNFVLQAEPFYDQGMETLSMRLNDVSVRTVLDRICEHDDFSRSIARHAVCLEETGEIPQGLDLRFYKIAPLLEGISGGDREDAMDRMVALVQELTYVLGDSNWECEGVSIESWGDVLVIKQTARMHAATLAVLERMLNRGTAPPDAAKAWRQPLEKALRPEVALSGEEGAPDQLLKQLTAMTGVPLRFGQGFHDEWGGDDIQLKLDHVSLATALEWIADLTQTRIHPRPGEIVLDQGTQLEVVFHDTGGLFGSVHAPRNSDLRGRVEDTIRNLVLPSTWDETPSCMITDWRDQLVVVQCAEGQAQIETLLDAVRRATRP